jgi:hypothetical protein
VNRPLADIRHELRDYLHSNPATNAEELEWTFDIVFRDDSEVDETWKRS